MSTGRIKKVAGPLVIAEGMRDANMYDVVRVSTVSYTHLAMEGAKQDIAALEALASGKETEAVELIISELV